MIATARALVAFFRSRAARREPLALATVVATEGSTYRKPGAQMLFAADGASMGLLSGGCLESDLAERAKRVIDSGQAELVTYDARTSDDPVWGLGLGCEGAMTILLTRLDEAGGYEPFRFVADCTTNRRAGATALVVESNDASYPRGHSWHSRSHGSDARIAPVIARCLEIESKGGCETFFLSSEDLSLTVFIAPVDRPARVLILGAGADATPVVEIAALLGWQVTVADHRSGYLEAGRFAAGIDLVPLEPQRGLAELQLDAFEAAVVMSHNLEADARHLKSLAQSSIPYVGLLGPAARRRRLLADLGTDAAKLGDRLYGPVGLDIGARTPEAIAVAIVAEIQAFLTGRRGEPFREGVLASAAAD